MYYDCNVDMNIINDVSDNLREVTQISPVSFKVADMQQP